VGAFIFLTRDVNLTI
jgi:predicted outer membrane repeat protein